MMAGMNTNRFNHYDYDPESIASKLVIVLFIMDVIFGLLIYIAGGLKSNQRLLRLYYCYSIVLCLLTILLAGVPMGLTARGWFTLDTSVQNLFIQSLSYMGCFVIMGLQVYFVLLLRKEMMNRKDVTDKSREIEFVTEPEYPIILNGEGEQKENRYL